MNKKKNPIMEAGQQLADDVGADVILYRGDLVHPYDEQLVEAVHLARRRDEVIFILTTLGGSAHSAYRMARSLQRHYGKVTVLVPGLCCSAGTLLAIGAHELVLCERCVLGPLDVQIRKEDELGETSSGLTLSQAMSALQDQAILSFESTLLRIKSA